MTLNNNSNSSDRIKLCAHKDHSSTDKTLQRSRYPPKPFVIDTWK